MGRSIRPDPIPAAIELIELAARLCEFLGWTKEAQKARGVITDLAGSWVRGVTAEADRARLVERVREMEERDRLREAALSQEKASLYLRVGAMLRGRRAAG